MMSIYRMGRPEHSSLRIWRTADPTSVLSSCPLLLSAHTSLLAPTPAACSIPFIPPLCTAPIVLVAVCWPA